MGAWSAEHGASPGGTSLSAASAPAGHCEVPVTLLCRCVNVLKQSMLKHAEPALTRVVERLGLRRRNLQLLELSKRGHQITDMLRDI